MEHFSNGPFLKWSISQMEQFSNGAILKWSDSQMEQFSNGAILKWSDLGSPPYAIFQDPKNREIWHAMCYVFPTHNDVAFLLVSCPTRLSSSWWWRPQIAPFENCSIWELLHLRIAPFENRSIWESLHLRIAPFEKCSIWEMLHLRNAPFEKHEDEDK